ncbi:beta-1, 3-galactosyltransferase [Brachyspira hampsonii]|uniref:Beta-1, 3-galactosyltransferase n=1 Tax=Brachyspira hampsonii TaxID=1287055 RepID=A0AAC9TU45_9SPIR|nr:glycosyltransferase family 2 protein [Brachyspira hampsonii]ASJ21518.1 beta-1, 3-galactosyltransferase [Brachyspira hampsonii]MBW5380599.1 glycosyltransferase family 2 protein [Brachyspira hampsonii]OEJ17980.1 beta-1, 3-galactosyltransferase [Brachyspira hampsonii]
MIKASVILPVYNIENYVGKCLDSVINQTLKDIEIICVNDCSTDNSENIIKKYIKKDNRIKLINHNENQGLGFSRNTGMYNSNSDYLVFIDPDDFVSSNFVEELYNTALKYDADMVFTNNMYTVNEKNGYIKPFYHNRINIWKKKFKNTWNEGISNFNVNTPEKENTPEYPLVSAVNKIFKKTFLEKNKLIYSKYRIAEDVDFFYRFLVHNPKMYYNNNAKYYYLQRSTSLAGSVHTTKKIPIAILEVFENVFNYYNENKKELLMDCNYYNFFSFLYTFNNYKADNKNEFYKKCHETMKKLDVEIDRDKHAFYAYSVYIMKTYDDYNIYLEKIESIKKKVFDIAWWIPSITLREKYKKINLDKLANKNWK